MAVAFFGDGAVNNGAFHEGLNMASIWKLPVLFVCENNQFATEVPFSYAAGNPSVASRGASYGMPGVDVDGNDVLAVYEAAARAVDRAREGEGPTLLECRTYRTRPHAEGMGDYTYRTRDEVEAWKTRCPILRFKSAIIKELASASSQFEAIESEIDTLVDDALQFAETSPWPDPATATRFVFAESHGRRRSPLFHPASRTTAPARNHLHAGHPRGPGRGDGARPVDLRPGRRDAANGAATSRRRPGFMTCTARSGSAIRRSASAGSSGSAAAPP